jgi:hypothetical protein
MSMKNTIFSGAPFGVLYNNKTGPEALKSLYRSPGYKKNQLVLCKNWETCFKNASSLKPLGQLKPNCPGMII